MVLTPDLIKLQLKKLGIRPDKYLGQHFLVDETVLSEIKKTAESFLQPNDTILEVGPGLGVLTSELVTFPNPVLAVERDPVFAHNLASFLEEPKHLTVVPGDILDDLHTNSIFQSLPSWAVVANIPYAITSPLLRKLVQHPNPPHHILVLVQKEVAERIQAEPGNAERGLLTVQLEIMTEAKVVMDIPPSAFWPEPKVESALLLLTRRGKPLIEAKAMNRVMRVVTAGFSAKRKQLVNSLGGGLGLPSEQAKAMLEQAGIDPMRRAETLTIAEWQALAEKLAEK